MNKKLLLIIPMLIGMMLMTAYTFPYDKEVMIQASNETMTVRTAAETVGQLLEENQLIITENEYVTPGSDVMLEDGMTINIRSTVHVWLEVDGIRERVLTTENTVKGLLDSAGIDLGPDDEVSPAVMTLLQPETEVKVARVHKEYHVEIVTIPPQEITRFTDNLKPNESQLIQEGAPGQMVVRRAKITRDGEPAGDLLVETRVLKPATDQVTEQGRERLVMMEDGTLRRYTAVHTMTATAYDAGFQSTGKNPGDPYYGITRSGTRVRPGVVAVDPRVIPLGSTLYVESQGRSASYGISHAEDTGGAIKGDRIDLYYESRSDALRFGRQPVKVYVLEDE